MKEEAGKEKRTADRKKQEATSNKRKGQVRGKKQGARSKE